MFLPCRSRRQEAAIALQRDDGRGAGPPAEAGRPCKGRLPREPPIFGPHHATPFRARAVAMPARHDASLEPAESGIAFGRFLNTQYEYNFPEPIPAPETVMFIKSVAFDHPTAGACGVGQAPGPACPRRKAPTSSSAADRLRRLLRERDAVMIAHYYVDGACRTWRAKPAAASAIRWKWRASAPTIPRPPGGGRRAFHGRNRQDPQPARAS